MSLRKYLFYFSGDKIRIFKPISEGVFETMRYKGEDAFPSKDWKTFYEWFSRAASIASDDYIDYCFLSDEPWTLPEFSQKRKSVSSWNKREIYAFCNNYVTSESYEICYDGIHGMVNQKGNVADKKSVKKIYLKCVPEFTVQIEAELVREQPETAESEISPLSRYYREQVKKIRNN